MIQTLLRMEGVPAHLLYMFLFALSAGMFGNFWSAVHGHPRLLEPPYSQYIKPGTDGPFILSLVCLAWEIFTWFPQESSWNSTRIWWAIVTLYRAIVLASFAIFTECQAQYLPLPLGSCANAYEWRNTDDVPKGTPTMWEILPLSSTRTKGGGSALVIPCAVLTRLRVFEFVLIGFLAVSMLESMAIFIWFPSDSDEIPLPAPWELKLNHAVSIPFRALSYLYRRPRGQKKTGDDPEGEMQPLAGSTGNHEPRHSPEWYRKEDDGIRVKPMPAEEDDGIRIRPMPDSANEGRPSNHSPPCMREY